MEQVKVEDGQPTIDLNSALAAKVKRQLEYYFGDVNYPKDKWMRAKAAENNGFIPIEVLLTFNRLKEITSDINLVKAVLKTIPDLEIVDEKVKRLKPIPDTFDHKARADCTVLLRGFTKGEPMVTIDEITEIMLPIANPISIFRKRTKRKEFKGKVLVQFSTPEEAKKALDVKEVNLKDQKISIMTQEQYFQMKTEELAKKGIVYQKPVPKRLKEKTDNSARKNKKQKKEEIKVEVPTGPQMVIGVLIEIKNVPQGIPFEDLKAYFARFGTVLFIDLSKIEQNIILARFSNPSETKDAFAEISEKKMEINNNVLDARMVTGEEEEKYWKEEIIPQMLRSQAKKNNYNYRNKAPSNRKKNNKRQKTFSNNKPEEKKETEKVTNE